MNPRILDAITGPDCLKALTEDELEILAGEIREEILNTTSATGGHVASSLGAVEIILAIHSLIDSPKDKLLFDVGHQAYAHKLITGRKDEFATLRQYGGISGFPKPSESVHDVHPSGHASDSLSVALGLAKARDLRGGDEKIVTIIGDASIAGGMAFEALNHIGQAQCPMLIILNDNEMSIGHNVGALMRHLGQVRATHDYTNAKDALQARLESGGGIARGILGLGKSWKESVKQFILPHSMIYEELGIVCTVPIDGHDIHTLREVFAGVLEADVPVLVHVVTKKGAGFDPAVAEPTRFHGTGPFDRESGAAIKGASGAPSYTSVFGDALVAEGERDDRIVAITAAMASGTGLLPFRERFMDRFIDTGISEGHAVGLAAGLAAGGNKPVVCIYSTFMQRAIDQAIIDCALSKFDVVFCIDRAGLVGADGPTHHGTFDIVYMRMIPNMRVMTPSNEAELVNALHTALALGGPFAIRYPRGSARGVALPDAPGVLPVGKSITVREGEDVALLAFGRMVAVAEDVAARLAQSGVEARVVDMRWAKPLDVDAIRKAADTRLVVTLEDGVIMGGAGEGVLDELSRAGLCPKTLVLGMPDAFVMQGTVDELCRDLGLDAESVASEVLAKLDE